MISALSSICLLAQDAGQGSPLGPLMPIITISVIFFLYIFIVQRPNLKREQDARRALLENLKKNDRVLTTSGIYGVVTNVQRESDEVTIRVDENTQTKLKITFAAVQRVLSDADGKDSKSETK